MTEQEVIKFLTGYLDSVVYKEKCVEAHKLAIKALKEIQQYQEIGLTPQMVLDLIKSEKQTHKIALENANKLDVYSAIGTVEECRAAVERNKTKKPIEYEYKFYACPVCGNVVMHKWERYPTIKKPKTDGLPYCLGCGQRLDWSDEE